MCKKFGTSNLDRFIGPLLIAILFLYDLNLDLVCFGSRIWASVLQVWRDWRSYENNVCKENRNHV